MESQRRIILRVMRCALCGDQDASKLDPFIFVTERDGPLARSTVNKLIERAGRNADIPFPVHPHMLRHACGYYLANKGVDTRTIQDYLGHVSITHSAIYRIVTS